MFTKLVPYFVLLFIVGCGRGGGSSASSASGSSGSSGSVAADSTPPIFSGFTSNVSFVSIGNSSENITLSITLEDNPSGIKLDELPTPKLKKTGSIDIEANSAWTLTSGDKNNGTYTAVITVPTTASPGDYYLFGGTWKDTRGNLVTTETNELGGMFNSGVTVFNSVETDPPVFSNLSVSPSTVDVSSSSQTVTLTLDVTDASGVNIPGVKPFIGKAASSNINADTFWIRTSGDNKNGSYSATVTVPTTASPGGYYLTSFYWSDIWGNSAISSTPSAGGASNNGLTVINSVAETNPPVFSNLSVSPSTVDVSSSSQTVTLTLDVTDASGVNIPGVKPFIGKAASSNINADTFWIRTSGDNKNGSYSATVTVPTTASPGGYYLTSFYWSDIWGNSAISSTPSAGGASNNGLTVLNN